MMVLSMSRNDRMQNHSDNTFRGYVMLKAYFKGMRYLKWNLWKIVQKRIQSPSTHRLSLILPTNLVLPFIRRPDTNDTINPLCMYR